MEVAVDIEDLSEGNLDATLWPRLAAVAEVAWTMPVARGDDDFPARAARHMERLATQGVRFHLPGPERIGTQTLFADTLDITLRNPSPVGTLHVTTDGTPPGSDAPVVHDVLTVTEGCTLRARVFVDGGYGSEELSVTLRREDALPSDESAPQDLEPGVVWAAFAGAGLEEDTGDGEPLEPLAVGWAPGLIRPAELPEPTSQLRFQGWIDVARQAPYALRASTAGRCLLELGTGDTARRFDLSADEPPQTMLAPGLHRAQLLWWPADPDDTLRLSWRRTDDGVDQGAATHTGAGTDSASATAPATPPATLIPWLSPPATALRATDEDDD